MEIGLSYHNIALQTKYKCAVSSRRECDISCVFGRIEYLRAPVVVSNMPSIINEETCKFLDSNEWPYIYHRFGKSVLDFSTYCYDNKMMCNVSVGVNTDSYNQINDYLRSKYNKADLSIICIDVAHGFSNKMKEMIGFLKRNLPNSYIIAGNLNSAEAVKEVEGWGADCCKLFIGTGRACHTYQKTGFMSCPVNVLEEVREVAKKDLMADGGIKNIGDLAKAFSLGADYVMAGHLFSGYEENPGDIVRIGNQCYKEYYGNASTHVKKDNRHIEGTRILVEYKGKMSYLLQEIEDSLKSAVSYSGGKTLEDLRNVKKLRLVS